MSFVTERSIVADAFLAAWDADKTPVKMSNVTGLVTGSSKIASQEGLAEWCQLSVVSADTVQSDLNSAKFIRSTGTITVNVFVKVGTGTNRARELADQVLAILQLKDLAVDFSTRAGNVIEVGQTPDSGFYQVNVRVQYYRNQLHNV